MLAGMYDCLAVILYSEMFYDTGTYDVSSYCANGGFNTVRYCVAHGKTSWTGARANAKSAHDAGLLSFTTSAGVIRIVEC